MRAARRLDARSRGAQLREERIALELDAERRLRPVPGIDDGLGRIAVGERPHRVEERVPVAARQVDAADRAGEEQVAAEERAVGVEGDVCRRVAGDRDALERDARGVDRLAALERDDRAYTARPGMPTGANSG